MIIKSYILENETQKLSDLSSILFYGPNIGLKKFFKDTIKTSNKKKLIINFSQDDIIRNEELLINELGTSSLFQEKKIIFVDQATDKIFPILQSSVEKIKENQIILFSENLDKKSKLRNYFERLNNSAAVACYEDNEISIRKIIISKLKGYRGLNANNINMIMENCGLDRVKLDNELSKIIILFDDKTINDRKLEALLNIKVNENFNLLKDEAINGNKTNTNKLLSETSLESEKNTLYLNIINQRLNKLHDVLVDAAGSDLEQAINRLKPPIFWKDKSTFLSQARKWNTSKIKNMLNHTYNLEIEIKSNSLISKNILIKKLLLDICQNANS
tara:strand:- start:419 stop:1411 length:993 start_codon:yes stop_codon:yes gene_type:complete